MIFFSNKSLPLGDFYFIVNSNHIPYHFNRSVKITEQKSDLYSTHT